MLTESIHSSLIEKTLPKRPSKKKLKKPKQPTESSPQSSANEAPQEKKSVPPSLASTAVNSAIDLTADAIKASSASLEPTKQISEIINKRLRTLKKRLARIEKCEESDKTSLNVDQLQSLEKKPEVVGSIRELEDLLAQVNLIDNNEMKLAKKKAKEAERELANKISEALNKEKAAHDDEISSTLRVFFALNSVLPNLPTSFLNSVAENQLTVLANLRTAIAAIGLEANKTLDDFTTSALRHLQLFNEKSEEEFAEGMSYKALGDLITLVLTPIPTPVFGATSEIPEQVESDNSVLETPVSADNSVPVEPIPETFPVSETVPSNVSISWGDGRINFINPSEVEEIHVEVAHSAPEMVNVSAETHVDHSAYSHQIPESEQHPQMNHAHNDNFFSSSPEELVHDYNISQISPSNAANIYYNPNSPTHAANPPSMEGPRSEGKQRGNRPFRGRGGNGGHFRGRGSGFKGRGGYRGRGNPKSGGKENAHVNQA